MKRDKAIDIAKGITMLLVIAGHCKYVNIDFKIFLYSFHMPMFFLLSGMVFSYSKHPSFFSFIKSKVKSLILPYFSLGIIIIICRNILNIYVFKSMKSEYFFKWGIEEIKNLALGNRLHEEYYGFWFILSLFVAIILFYLIIKKIEKTKYKNIFLIIVSILSYILQLVLFKYVKGFYWSLDLVPLALSFLSLGYFLKINIEKFKTKIFNFNVYTYIIVVILILLSYLNYHYYSMPDVFYCKVGSPIIFAITSLLGIYVVLTISYKLKESKVLGYIGQNTYTYYFFHSNLVFAITEWIIWKICILANIQLSKSVLFYLHMFITCIILYVISFIINKYLPFLYGKRRKNEKK